MLVDRARPALAAPTGSPPRDASCFAAGRVHLPKLKGGNMPQIGRSDVPEPPLDYAATQEPVLLLLGVGSRESHRFALRQIAEGQAVMLLDSVPPAWGRPYLAAHVTLDLSDHRASILAAREIASRQPVAGVLTYLGPHEELAARIAQNLGLPGASPETVAACRDSTRTHRLLAEHAVPSARTITVAGPRTAVETAQEPPNRMGYPAVVEPRAATCGAGVRRADSAWDKGALYNLAATETVPGPAGQATGVGLAEKHLDGLAVSVECVVLGRGDIHVAAVIREQPREAPSLPEAGHCVDAADTLRVDPAINAVATAALNAVGVTTGAVRVKMSLTSSGPHVVAIDTALGGDPAHRLVELATGVSLPRAAADLATGRRPDLTPSLRQAAAVMFRYPTAAGRLDQLALTDRAAGTEPWLERLVLTGQEGEHVTAPTAGVGSCLAYTVVTGPDAATCRTRAQHILQRIAVHITATTHVTACVR